MSLKDEEAVSYENKKIEKAIFMAIIILTVLCFIIVGIIVYKIVNPTAIIAYVDNKKVANFEQILDIQKDEKGNTKIYIPIREFADFLKKGNSQIDYKTYKGDYNPKTEEDNKCYIIRDKYEVAIFTEKSKTIYKQNLQKDTSNGIEYTEVNVDQDIFSSNGKLYGSEEAIEKGYNVDITYNEKKKRIQIYTIDNVVNIHKSNLLKVKNENYGTMEIDQKNFENCKAVFDNLLVVKTKKNNKYGIIKSGKYDSFVLEPQYDSIEYISDSGTFLVESNKKVGIFTKDGTRKIDLIYDEIISMGQKSNLYVVKTNNQYGVVDENGTIIIHPENEKIGIDINDFLNNGIKNGYFILNDLIPARQNKKWAFYDKQGNNITKEYKYDKIGCTKTKTGNNMYGLLQLYDYDVVVVGDELGKYWFMESDGNDAILPHVFDKIYTKVTDGKENYLMTYKEKDYDVLKYIKQMK